VTSLVSSQAFERRAEQVALPTRGNHRLRGIFWQAALSGCSPRAAGL
jgi:hypothetical protein